ncbi:hypothetical protein [Teichococcus wenyumeiae]|uniref:hypothetical protein n=1 Tax=Teichococcus wenyumeiae TaxID=2478470 RepID=UPI0011C3EF30|nr:hypothetical protein [Pseudoroseomonas wenyumeiae]
MTKAAQKQPADRLAPFAGSQSPAHNNVLLNRALQTGWVLNKDGDGEKEAAEAIMVQMAAFAPKDAVEGMIAAQAVALHNASMECFRRAMLREQPADIASRMRRDGANLARSMVEMTEALERRRGKGPQVVRVERVVVQEGGQAIVGNVNPKDDSR